MGEAFKGWWYVRERDRERRLLVVKGTKCQLSRGDESEQDYAKVFRRAVQDKILLRLHKNMTATRLERYQ